MSAAYSVYVRPLLTDLYQQRGICPLRQSCSWYRRVSLVLCFTVAGMSTLAVAGCERKRDFSFLEHIRTRGSLAVLTRNAPTTYFEDHDRHIAGFEHDLAGSFARYLGVTPRFVVLEGEGELLDALRRGVGDMIAAGITRHSDQGNAFLYGPVYQEVDQQVVCRMGNRKALPSHLLQLAQSSVIVVQDSPQEARLKELRHIVPELSWQGVEDQSTEQLLERVWRGEVDCTVADSEIVDINRRYFPELVVKFPISATQPLAWVLPGHAADLQRELEAWFQQVRSNGEFEAIQERYFGYVDTGQFDYVDNVVFLDRMVERLPLYEKVFQLAEQRHRVPWTLLAALSYQESQWDPQAVSRTGVRGLMMLTIPTAQEIGVKNRLDPVESILGGAGYLTELMRRLPAEIREPDRTWIALAAYNVGLGHVEDIRQLAVRQGKNPNLWYELKNLLPLLSVEKYYREFEHGYARGMEPVQYVQRIRHYHDLLLHREALLQRPRAQWKPRAGDKGQPVQTVLRVETEGQDQ